MLTLEIDNSTQYATAYEGDMPVATLQRRRVLDKGPEWKVFAVDGSLLFETYFNLSADRMATRIAAVLLRRSL